MAHALVIGLLYTMQPQFHERLSPQPLIASLVQPEQIRHEPEPPKPLPPSPRPLPDPPVLPPPAVLATPEPAPVPALAEVAPPPPEPVPLVLPPPQPAPPVPVPVLSAPPAPRPQSVQAPRFDADYLHNPAPAYPALSRRMGEEGRVLLRVHVHADGRAGEVEIRESSGFDRLDRAALDTVARWRFVPARQGERAVAAWVLVPISFSLRS